MGSPRTHGRSWAGSPCNLCAGNATQELAGQSTQLNHQAPSSARNFVSKRKVKSDWGRYRCWFWTLPLTCKQAERHTCTHSCIHAQSGNPILKSSVKKISIHVLWQFNKNQVDFWLAKIFRKETFRNLYLSNRIQMLRPFCPGLKINLFGTIIVYM